MSAHVPPPVPPAVPPVPPPPAGPLPAATPPPPARNPAATTALTLGLVGLGASVVPVLNLVGAVGAVAGIVLGIIGAARARRTGTGRGAAVWGVVTSAVAIVVTAAVTVVTVLAGQAFLRYLGDLFDTVEPPEASVEVGEEFETDEGRLRITVTRVRCESADGTDVECAYRFVARNLTDRPTRVGDTEVKAVVDGQFDFTSLDGGSLIEPGQQVVVRGTVRTYGSEQLEGIAFDGTDASSHRAVVVDLSAAWEEARTGK